MRLYIVFFLISITSLNIRVYSQELQLIPFSDNLRRPVDIAHAGDERLFVVEKDGTIVIVLPDGNIINEPYLDIRGRVNAFANERGLLGLAFHPDYQENGFFYVHYTNAQGNSIISRFEVDPADPDRALSNSELILMTVTQPFNNHNAGDLNFGPDGYLYIAMGDGGNAGDPGNRSQNPKELLGKILRIDVNNGGLYSIPEDNPFFDNADTLQEIWSIGWRNPWRFSFDRLTGDMWIADVGQNAWEEINMEPLGFGGLNYGWRCYEGNNAFNTSGCRQRESYTFPVYAYPNRFDVGCSVTGGYVYRGNKYPAFSGKYLYTDFCTGIFWMLHKVGDNWINTELADLDNQDFVTFGEDSSGELYVAGLASGTIYKVTDARCAAFISREFEVNITNPICPGQCTGVVEISGDVSALNILWSDGTAELTKENICPGSLNFVLSDNAGCSREFTIEIVNPDSDSLILSVLDDSLFASGNTMQQYNWFFNNILIATTSEPFLVPESNGIYYVKGINSSGCEVTSDIIVFTSSSVENYNNPETLKILQNPLVSQTLRWKYDSSSSNLKASVFSLNGKLMANWQVNNHHGDIHSKTLDNLPAGEYIFIVNGRGIKFILL